MPHTAQTLVTFFEPRLYDTYPAQKRSLPVADKSQRTQGMFLGNILCRDEHCDRWFESYGGRAKHERLEHPHLWKDRKPRRGGKENNLSDAGASTTRANAAGVSADAVGPTPTGSPTGDDPEPADAVRDAVMNIPKGAPLIDMTRSHTDAEARQHGFADAEDWLARSKASSSLGLDYIPLAPHEQDPHAPDPRESLPSAAEPVTLVPPVPGSKATEPRLSIALDSDGRVPPAPSVPVGRTLKRVRKA